MSATPDSLPVKPTNYDEGNTSPSSGNITDEEVPEQRGSDDKVPSQQNVKDGQHTFATLFKYSYSLVLLLFSIVVVTAIIFTDQTKMAADVNAAVGFILLWVLTLWLAVMEGGQGCLVGLQPVDKTLFAKSHPKALKVTNLAHKGNNLERFIVGRQFLVVFVIFAINLCGSALKGANVLNLPDLIRSKMMR
jgi:hypothetical protein